jgi:hypothetical protein
MTHDEVIAWINKELSWLGDVTPKGYGIEQENYRASFLANRDVLERHEEIDPKIPARKGYMECKEEYDGEYDHPFPCRTVLDILQQD